MTEFEDALSESNRNPVPAELLPGLVRHPFGAGEDLRAIQGRLADRAGLDVMRRIREAGRSFAAGGSGELLGEPE